MIFGAVAAVAAGLAVLPFVLAGEIGDGVAIAVVVGQAVLMLLGTIAAGIAANRAARQRV
jgi:hypothetical protein